MQRLGFLIAQEVKQAHVGTALGAAWTVIQPVMILGAYFFLFTVLRVSHTAPHGELGQVAILLSGLVPWWFFIRCFSGGLSTLIGHAPLVKQINYPIGVLPFATVGLHLVDVGIGVVMVVALGVWQGWLGPIGFMLIPAVLLLSAFLTGMVAVLSLLGPMLRDLRNFIPVIMRLGLWLSPVLYLPGTIPTKYQWIEYINPFCYFLNLFRYGALGGQHFGKDAVAFGTPWLNIGVAVGLTALTGIVALMSWGYARRVAVDYL